LKGKQMELYNSDGIQLFHGDCREVLATLPDHSVDAVVSDPPYGLSFMGKRWDYDVPSVEVWQQCLRVLKPGGHLLAFAGTRTQHRMACRIEDAGFEIRDMIAWVYGGGMPKSLDVSKAIDKRGGAIAGFEQFRDAVKEAMRQNGVSRKQLQSALGNHMLSHYLTAGSQPAIPTYSDFKIIRDTVGLGNTWDYLFAAEAEREVIAEKVMTDTREARIACSYAAQGIERAGRRLVAITAPATEAAKQWQGWHTSLKPALEPLTLARKPLEGTVAASVLQYGTGAINVDGTRIEGDAGDDTGRWPANFIHDGSREVTGILGEEARFFYCPKTSAAERGRGNNHPTVKPIDLMRYLCRMVTPPGGLVLDPFAGSGSTLLAARREGFRAIGIELSEEYCGIIRSRLGEPEEASSEVLEGQRTLF
jgi:DNA modification methylase/transcriptional regulator with XRE-family HTH domain